jgi:hypothetical protein
LIREFVIIYRKIFLTFLTFLSQNDLQARGYIVFYVISISCWIHYWAKPFITDFYNELEMRSLVVSVLTVYMGLFFVTEVNDLAQAIMFIAIISINAHFLLLWFTSTIRITIETLIESYGFVLKFGSLMKPIVGIIAG